MADKKYPDPTIPGPSDGNVGGVSNTMPDRGTDSGMIGMGAPYGADISQDATDRLGGMGRSTQSDPMDECHPRGGGDFTANIGARDESEAQIARGPKGRKRRAKGL